MRWFGAANMVAVLVLAWLYETAFISLWCAWAAITSISIALWLRAGAGDGRPSRATDDMPSGDSIGVRRPG